MTAKSPDWLVHGDGFADITLNRPLKVDGTEVTVVRMREPDVADQLVMDKAGGGDAAKEIALFANLCQLAPSDLHGMKLRDYKRLQTTYMGFTD